MTSLKCALAVTAALFLVSPVAAQQRVIVEQGNNVSRQENSVRVQDNINLFLPGPSGDSDEAQKLREKARRIVYDMAAHECDMLRGILAKDCRLETINVNVNANGGRQFNQQQQEGFNLSGSMSLQITLK